MENQEDRDEKILEQMGQIAQEVSAQPLIGDLQSPAFLLTQYQAGECNIGFINGIRYLETKYAQMRCIRGDGNCFYRALLFSYLESLLRSMKQSDDRAARATAEHKRFMEVVALSKADLVEIGYNEFTFEDFYDEFFSLLTNLPSMDVTDLYSTFLQAGMADTYTWYMRLLTAAYLRKHEDRFFPFVLAEDTAAASSLGVYHADMTGYCQREVEPMGRECEQVHIIALTEYLGVGVSIEYLDGRLFDELKGLSCISFPTSDVQTKAESSLFWVTLLYRPGHYDILYSLC